MAKPVFAERHTQLEEFTQQWRPAGEEMHTAREVVRIPMVVHVVWRTAEQNISDAQIQSQIEVLNEDFRRLNSDIDQITIPFQQSPADLEIEFYLAEVDPDGSPTNGITRTATTTPNIGDFFTTGRRAICYADLGGADAWCPDEYINVWVGELSAGLAVTSFPEMDIPDEDGIRIEPQVFGTIGTVEAPYDLGRTLTHELGHYFNLFHLWGSAFSCDVDDGVDDTPLQSDWYLNTCPGFLQISCGTPDMYMNFMNFTDDACLHLFTEGQKDRVWATLNSTRSGLIMGNNCGVSSVSTSEEDIFEVFPNPTTGSIRVELPQGQKGQLYLQDLNGNILQIWSVNSHLVEEIMLKEWPVGIYFLKFVFRDMYLSKKLVLIR
ncbi:MAG: M43 family zinc metalloprotease [Bacteroidota bacterium]